MEALRKTFFLILLILTCKNSLFAQDDFDESIKRKMEQINSEPVLFAIVNFPLVPSSTVQSITTPTGWGGGNRNYVFAVLGGIFPALYTTPNTPDLIGSIGASLGNPTHIVNVSASVNVTRVTELNDFSANLVVSKRVGKASSIAAGALQIFANPDVSDAPDQTYFIAFSHAIQKVKSRAYGYSALSYTIGFGTGRFLYKSPMDLVTGKGKYGTGVFANVSYEIIPRLNINAEWSGLNLGGSLGFRPLGSHPVSFGIGVYNLTNYSGDRITYLGVVGIPIFLKKRKEYEW